ncbi:hypothetical protein ANOM_007206 [Aspergillus nomiae NRRL 13137]|uniref:Uncharacterized protein n=1 Tax=Aspergillus nomiae NRRL (strain ATCC 15546 / NRRL 13137 / CBS 260.88 / M93) TaxID=1509407 RepID=A0A0L1IVW3_ASPN3|nr:uncharacterized protein ANOM_007206 [Aspergillus nomiae NRRL 13137]KNG83632.1 hypothetical protein ANOM_007206 [Aspergillus nomiae NRRL 13137]
MIDTTGTVWHIIYQTVALSIKLGFAVRAGRFTVAHTSPVVRVRRRRALQGPGRDALAVDQRHAIGTHGLLLRLALIVLVGGITVRTGREFVGNTFAVLKPSGRATVRWSGLKLASIAHRFPSGATSTAVVLRGAQDSIPDRAFRTALSGVRDSTGGREAQVGFWTKLFTGGALRPEVRDTGVAFSMGVGLRAAIARGRDTQPNLLIKLVVASKSERTKFRVTGRTRPEKDHVMIRSDHISITVIGKDDGYVRNDDGILVTGGSGSDTFLFSDFKTAFLPSGVSDDAVMKKVEHGGDEWELVA